MNIRQHLATEVDRIRRAKKRRRDGYVASDAFYSHIQDVTLLEVIHDLADELMVRHDQVLVIQASARKLQRVLESKVRTERLSLEFAEDVGIRSG